MCEPSQSKCTLTLQKSHFVREITGKCRGPEARPTLAQSTCIGHFTRAILCENLQEKMLGPRSATQTLCEPAQVMHLVISQEPFCARIYRKNAGAQKRDADFVRACAVELHFKHVTRTILHENLQDKCRGPDARRLRSRNALGHFTRAILCENIQEKCRRPAGAP